MSIEYNPPHNYARIHLSTALMLMFAVPVGALCFLRASPWVPEETVLTEKEIDARFPERLKKSGFDGMSTPDGTRRLSTLYAGNRIWDTAPGVSHPLLFDFSFDDADNELYFNLDLHSKNGPPHMMAAFIDDDHCLLVHEDGKNATKYRVWRRRFPEWWWGHLYRPEVWAAGVLGLMLLITFVKFVKADNARILGDRARRREQSSIA